MSIQSYQTLYESSIAYGMRKALMEEAYKTEMQTNITNLRQKCEDLEAEVARLEQSMFDTVKQDVAERESEGQKHKKEITFYEELNEDYTKELKEILTKGTDD